jgi:hypothetical protein
VAPQAGSPRRQVAALLEEHGLDSATDVFVGGCSAGAYGLYQNIDAIADWVHAANPAARVIGMPSAGWFGERFTTCPLPPRGG